MKYKLSDICDIKVGYPFKSHCFNKNGNGVRLVRGMNISKNGLRWGNQTRWWSNLTKELNDYYLKSDDVLIAMDGNVNTNFALIKKEDLPLLLVQRVARLRSKVVPQRLIWYIIKTRNFSLYMNAVKTGTTISHVSAQQIGDYEVELPDLEAQGKIVNILSTLDEKIANNNAINANLQQQVFALYIEMFVNVPNTNRRICRAEQYFDISIGKTPPRKESMWFSDKHRDNIVWVSISDMGKSNIFISDSSEYLTKNAVNRFNIITVPDNTVILSFKLTVGRIAITDGEITTNEAIAHFKTDNKIINEYLFCYLKNYNYQTLGSTSSIATAINSKIVKAIQFIVPEDEELKAFHAFAAPSFEKIRKNLLENKRLAELRDTLLPKLMSGEIDVSDIEI